MTGKVVILRPEPAASRTARQVAKVGLTPVKLPLFKIEPVQWSAPDVAAYDGLLLTSANGLRFAGPQADQFKTLPVFAVGPATAKVAEARGFTVARTGRADIVALLANVSPNMKLLHLAGRNRLDHQLPRPRVDAITVYRAALLEKVDIAPVEDSVTLVHSPRAGRRLAELAGEWKGSVTIVAISARAALACGQGWKTIVSVDQPDERAMVALAVELCDKPVKA